MRENVEKFDMKTATASWTKLRDLRLTLTQYPVQQNCFGTGEIKTIERGKNVRRYVGGMTLHTDLCLAMRTDPLVSIRGVREFVMVIYGPAVTFAFPGPKIEFYRRSMLYLNLLSVVDLSKLNWCGQDELREALSKDLRFD